ncbi:MAG: hypothetical protein OEZ52_15545 [Candidatus Aminicenantes bacterium]|nr:hypothetical protein [Candidatus Aminicenantes bacterium]
MDTNLISFANRRCRKEVFELTQLFLVVAALFIGNGILFTIPKGDRNAFACFAIGEKIDPTIALLSFGRRDNTLLKELYSFI